MRAADRLPAVDCSWGRLRRRLGASLAAATLRLRRGARPAGLCAILPYTAAAIHHGGAGTTHALVVHAVPQVVVPHAADQHRQARAVAHTGAGFHMPPRRTTIDNLVNCLAALLPDLSVYRSHARTLQAEFDALGGVPAAATMLEEAGFRA